MTALKLWPVLQYRMALLHRSDCNLGIPKFLGELWLNLDGAVKSRFILGAGPSIFGHDYIARQKDR